MFGIEYSTTVRGKINEFGRVLTNIVLLSFEFKSDILDQPNSPHRLKHSCLVGFVLPQKDYDITGKACRRHNNLVYHSFILDYMLGI